MKRNIYIYLVCYFWLVVELLDCCVAFEKKQNRDRMWDEKNTDVFIDLESQSKYRAQSYNLLQGIDVTVITMLNQCWFAYKFA